MEDSSWHCPKSSKLRPVNDIDLITLSINCQWLALITQTRFGILAEGIKETSTRTVNSITACDYSHENSTIGCIMVARVQTLDSRAKLIDNDCWETVERNRREKWNRVIRLINGIDGLKRLALGCSSTTRLVENCRKQTANFRMDLIV